MQKKVGDDNANLWVVSLAWYGFLAIFPLLLIVVTVFGYIGAASLGNGIVSTLRRFPIIGADLQVGSGGHSLHGSPLGLIVGIAGLFYGAQGVTQTAEQTMSTVWNVPKVERPDFLPRLGRSVAGLLVIGAAALNNALASGYATSNGQSWAIRIPVVAALVLLNVGAYLLAFGVLTPEGAAQSATSRIDPGRRRVHRPDHRGTGLIQNVVSDKSNTYGAFGTVIGIVAFLGILAKVSIHAAELNPVVQRRLYPRQFLAGELPPLTSRSCTTSPTRNVAAKTNASASASGTRPRPKQPPTPGNATTTQPSHNSIPAPATNHQPSRKALRLRHRGSPATQPPQHRPTPGSRHPRLGQRLEHPPKTLHLDQRRRRDLRIPRTTIKPNLRRGTLVVSLPSLLDADQQLAYRA